MTFPITIRMPYGGGVRAPELHDDSPETYYVHTPGIKVAIPSTPADAKGLLAAAIRDPDPVVILEPKVSYRTERGEVPEGEHVVPLGKARLAREGSRPDARRLRRDGAGLRARGRRARRVRRGARPPLAEAARRGGAARVRREDRPRRARPGGAADVRLRRRAGRDPRREGDARPAGAGVARDRATTCRTRTGRSRTRTCPRSRASSTPPARCSTSSRRDPRAPARCVRTCTGTSRASWSRCSRSIRATRCGSRRRTPAGASAATSASLRATPGATPAMRSPARSRSAARARARCSPSRIDEVVPGPWGVTIGGPDARGRVGARGTGSGEALGRRSGWRPFLGVLGMPPAEPGSHSTIPPRRWGGNIDCKELVAGTTLYLPIPSTVRSSPPATVTPRRATARCPGRRSRRRSRPR